MTKKPALELITVRATNPSTGAAGAAVTGNSLTIRQTSDPVAMLNPWQTRSGAGLTRITSPLLHDSSVGIQFRGPAGPSVGWRDAQTPLFGQDTLSVTLVGSASAEEHSSWLHYYEDLPGVAGNFLTYDEFWARVIEMTGVLVTTTPGTTAFGTQVAINNVNDNLKANEDYAIVGATFTAGVATVGTHALRVTSSDFGNLGVGLPANGSSVAPANEESAQFFLDLAFNTGLPVIPVFNSANKAQTFVDTIGAAATSTTAGIMLAHLGKARAASRRKRR